MAQNSARLTWAPVEVDAKLKAIMENCYDQCFNVAKEYTTDGGKVPSLAAGANISGFIKVCSPMSRTNWTNGGSKTHTLIA